MSEMPKYIMCSGGKDSMLTVHIAAKKNIKIDGVVIGRFWFDKSERLSAEHPVHDQWLDDVCIPMIENKYGFPVIQVEPDKDYIDIFNERITRSKHPERVGKKKGFPLAMGCVIRRDLKLKPVMQWGKSVGEYEKILGIGLDELDRNVRLIKGNTRSLMSEYGYIGKDAFVIGRKEGFISPYYELGESRQGCWFCPNASVCSQARFAREYPQYWDRLRILDKDTEKVSNNFSYGRTFGEIDRQIQVINGQISFFD